MASTNYPGSLDAYPVPNNGDTISVADHWLGPAVIGIETELGTDPAGSFTDVKSRLDDTDGKVITEIDQFKLTSTYSLSTINTFLDLTANLSRDITQKGTGMQEGAGGDPAGVFSFPETGYYFIDYRISFVSPAAASNYTGGAIVLTNDNFSTVFGPASYTSIFTTSTYAVMSLQVFFKVDDTSTHKCKFQVYSQQTVTVESDRTSMRFIRLGDV